MNRFLTMIFRVNESTINCDVPANEDKLSTELDVNDDLLNRVNEDITINADCYVSTSVHIEHR